MPSSYLHYDIQRKLGQGGMGIVYLAKDTRLHRNVALKFLPPHIAKNEVERQRFEIEARAAAGLSHTNIAQVYAIEEVDDELFIALEYVDGQELKDIIEEGTLSTDDKLEIVSQIASGMYAAHQKGVIHRDIKTRNIMVDTSGSVKIMDFGLARLEGTDPITKTGTTIGTTAYMSPEQLRGRGADVRSDIWSFGVVLYELFSGEMPFRGLHEPAVMYSITEDPPHPLDPEDESVPEYIKTIITRCLAKNPDERYQSVAEILADLKSQHVNTANLNTVTASSATMDSSEVHAPPSRVSPKTTKYLTAGIAVVSLLIVAFYFLLDGVSSLGEDFPDKRYLAVLPIENIGGNPEMQAICDGLAETFSYRLSELEQYEDFYWVTPASEIRKENVFSASQANRIFGVNLAISASIQTVQDSTRMILELVDADNVRRLSTRQITVHSDDLALLETNAIRELIKMLEIDIRPKMEQAIFDDVPSDPKAYEFYLKGRASLQKEMNLDDLNEAIDFFEQAVILDPQFALGYAGLGEGYWRQYEVTGDVEYVGLAETALNRANSINDQLAPVQHLYGLVKSGTGDYEESISYFERSLEIDPKFTASYREMANVYNEIGNTARALDTYQQVIELKPDYWEGYKDLGVYHLSNGNFDGAIQNFEEVVEITPNNSIAFSNLGIAYFYKGDNERAREMFEKSLELDENPLTANNLAGIYFVDEMYSEAAEMYMIVLDEYPNRYDVWGNYAAAVDLSGDSLEARDLYRTAIEKAKKQSEVNPNDPLILADIGAYYSDLNNVSEARNYINRALEINDQNVFIRLRAVSIYEKLNMREMALQWVSAEMIEDIESQPELQDLAEDPAFLALKNQLVNQANN
ncbi:MAG: protein kinase [Balneolaceae bacterium]|nr:protein kinase [Balneolaceae bacterium]MDR9410474.1 protein kinase [Balneolaceae bacterium]